MTIKLENVAIAIRDLDAAAAFFTDLGLAVVGTDEVSGEWADTAVGLDGNHVKLAMLPTPGGEGTLELFEYLHPAAIETEPTLPHTSLHRASAPRRCATSTPPRALWGDSARSRR